MIEIKCPHCASSDMRYVQRCTQYSYIEEIHEDGHVEIQALDDTYFDDDYYLSCVDCHRRCIVKDGALRPACGGIDDLFTMVNS